MSNFIQFIIDGLVEGYEFIADTITFFMNTMQFTSDMIFGINAIPLFTVVPIALTISTLKFILRRGK